MSTDEQRHPTRYDVLRLLSEHRYSWAEGTANDWKCECGWFGNHLWRGWSEHFAAEYARLSRSGGEAP